MGTRVVITHTKGTKINQIEQLPLDNATELSIGRDPAATIAFDPQRDDMVSRRHAVIRVTKGEPPTFKIADLGSSNGTLVNGSRITSDVELLPGDTIELGLGGPQFTFDLQPRPAQQPARTRVLPMGGMAGAPAGVGTATVVTQSTLGGTPSGAGKRGVGQETVERMLTAQRQGQSKVWAYSLAGVLALIAITGGAIHYVNQQSTDALLSKVDNGLIDAKKEIADNATKLAAQMGLSPRDIVQKYGNATTYIEVEWRLYDKGTGKPLYQKTVQVKGMNGDVPAYVKMANGTVVRWLTTEDENRTNLPIGFEGSGSGFVVSANGRNSVLTNKHVAAGWKVEYGLAPYEQTPGVLFEVDASGKGVKMSPFDPSESASLRHWIPDDGGFIFDPKQPVPIGGGQHLFEGRNEQLDIRFPGQRVSYASRLIQASPDADVATISIDSVQGLTPVEIEQEDKVQVGDKVTVLGYPGISEQTYATTVSDERGRLKQHEELIPEPTVTDGGIAKIGGAVQQQGASTISGDLGNAYQLTVLATGAGNSGGPVFDAAGKVIALFTYSRTVGAERVTFAVPIRYGRELLTPQRVN